MTKKGWKKMDYQEFLAWLEGEKKMGTRSARDVVSRLKRVVGMLGTDVLDDASVLKLNEVDAFDECSMYIKSQLRRSINLYLEYLRK